MKTLLIIAGAIVASLQLAVADLRDDLIGKWSGTATANVNGVLVPEKITVVFKKYQNVGLIVTTTIQIKGRPTSIGVARYRDNGVVDGEMKINGSVVAVLKGEWGMGRKKITQEVVARGIIKPMRIKSGYTLTSKNRLTSSSKATGGTRAIAVLTRK